MENWEEIKLMTETVQTVSGHAEKFYFGGDPVEKKKLHSRNTYRMWG